MRNLKISKVIASNGDAIGIQKSTNVWVDHCDLSSDMDHDKDFYDGLLDVTHASDWVTISNTYLHDHVSFNLAICATMTVELMNGAAQWKTSLVGHSDSNSKEDTGHLHVTYANNNWNNINSRAPSFRFGTGHIFK